MRDEQRRQRDADRQRRGVDPAPVSERPDRGDEHDGGHDRRGAEVGDDLDDLGQRVDAQVARDVDGQVVDPRLPRLGRDAAEQEEAKVPTTAEREQRRQLEPEVAGREPAEAEAGGEVGHGRGRLPEQAPRGHGEPHERAHQPAVAPLVEPGTRSPRCSGSRRSRTRKYSPPTTATTVPNANSPRETYW